MRKVFDFGALRDSMSVGSKRNFPLTISEKNGSSAYVLGHLYIGNICLLTFSRMFPIQLGFSQGVLGTPTSMVKNYGSLQDSRNACDFYSVEDTNSLISYPKLPTHRTYGFTKWLVDSFQHTGFL